MVRKIAAELAQRCSIEKRQVTDMRYIAGQRDPMMFLITISQVVILLPIKRRLDHRKVVLIGHIVGYAVTCAERIASPLARSF